MEREQPFHSSPLHAAGEVCGSLSLPEPDFGKCRLKKQTRGSNPSSHSQGIQPILSHRCWPRLGLGGIIPTRKMNIWGGLLLIVSHPEPFLKTFKGTGKKNPGFPKETSMDLMSSQALPMAGYLWGGSMKHGLMDMGKWLWKRVGSLQCLELCGNGILGFFHPRKTGHEGKNGEKAAGLWCHSCGIRKGNDFLAKVPQKAGHP